MHRAVPGGLCYTFADTCDDPYTSSSSDDNAPYALGHHSPITIQKTATSLYTNANTLAVPTPLSQNHDDELAVDATTPGVIVTTPCANTNTLPVTRTVDAALMMNTTMREATTSHETTTPREAFSTVEITTLKEPTPTPSVLASPPDSCPTSTSSLPLASPQSPTHIDHWHDKIQGDKEKLIAWMHSSRRLARLPLKPKNPQQSRNPSSRLPHNCKRSTNDLSPLHLGHSKMRVFN